MVSIIIVAYKNNYLTLQCLYSIIENTEIDYELLVVDNNSQLRLDDQLVNRVRLIKNNNNQGFARGCNQGALQARGKLLLFLNNDTIVTPGWLEVMVNTIYKSNDIGIVGSKLLFPGDGMIQHAGIVFNNRLPGHIYYKKDPTQCPIHQEKEFPAVTGACLLIKKKIFYAVGGFDEIFVNSYEDVDLCLKVRELGFRIIYAPESLVYHYGSMSPDRHKYDRQNLNLLLNKWKHSQLLD